MAQFYTEEEATTAIKKFISKKMLQFARRKAHEAFRVYPESRQIRYLIAHIAVELRDFNAATGLLEQLNAEDPGKFELLKLLTNSWNGAGYMDKAILYTNEVHEITGNEKETLLTIADIYERNNKIDLASETLEKLSKETLAQPKFINVQARILISNKQFEQAIELIENNVERIGVECNEQSLISVLFMQTKAYNKLGDYDMAWATAKKAHDLDTTPFDMDRYMGQFTEMQEFMVGGMLDALVKGPETDVEPLFIVGNPRSGTSLLEQIMSMHPDIENCGEMSVGMPMQLDVSTLADSFHNWPNNLVDLRENEAKVLSDMYFEAVEFSRNGEKIVSNKALNLPLQVGFFSKIMPSSRAIMLHRHPLDNAVSCYTTNLLAAGHPYTNRIENLGKVWVARRKIVEMWMEQLSIPVMELHYENLVANQRDETKRLISFLGLEWDEKCIEFHKSKRVAKTISYDQVNKKMYSTSSGRWKNYEKHLGPLMDIVGDYM
ncbi:MAG: hypothetical protein HOI88_05145 [Phycisphaerae bacterium]|jgi:tetratricopeptide (TPR) repeat protein|nr:hypothetical protein [Deltaproteobacteria bacterium]MBT5366368.1 hypothetical protein [Phycisphaerae bacterium]MBT6269717.1 hypothetical protein [Phycisphaerae bacterium]MBT6281924.1 hypothetical protein [Phycisphaerae bacterium]